MSKPRFPEEFKIEAVQQVTERGYPVAEVAREEARRDIFDYIEMFYNPKRWHGSANGLSPVEFEKQYFQRFKSV